MEVRRHRLDQLHHGARQLLGAFAAFRPVARDHERHAMVCHLALQQRQLGLSVVAEVVDRDDTWQTVVVVNVVDVPLEVRNAFLKRLEVLLMQRGELGGAVHLQRADGRDDHHGIGPDARFAALDVDELLCAQVCAEARLGDHIVGELECTLRRNHRVAAVCDVRERPTVHERRGTLQTLHEIGRQRVLEERGHRTVRVEILRRNRPLIVRIADHDCTEALLQVLKRRGEAEDSHDLGCGDDVETVLPRIAVARPAERDGYLAKRPVVHVDHAPPGDAAHIQIEVVAVVDVVINQCRQQVVGERDGVEVAGEVQVDILHRHDLRITAARRAALHTEHRPERGLAQADHRLLADIIEPIAEADRRGGLSFTRRRRRHPRHEHELAVLHPLQRVEVIQRYLGFVMAIRLEMFFGEAELLARDRRDALKLRGLCDFDVRLHYLSVFKFRLPARIQ